MDIVWSASEAGAPRYEAEKSSKQVVDSNENRREARREVRSEQEIEFRRLVFVFEMNAEKRAEQKDAEYQ